MKSYLLKIRGGVEVDSLGKKAGKGPLVAEEISNTLGTHQDQYLFQPTKVVGTLMASGYQKQGVQEAMNDMYVVEKLNED